MFFSVLSQHINGLTVVASSIPASLYMFHKFLGTSEERFTKYVVCIKCFKLYKVEDAVTSISGVTVSRACDNILFPNHPFSRFRKKCGQVLMTTLASSSGRKTLVPLNLYVYKSFKQSLKEFISRENFEEKCEAWRNRSFHDDLYCDVYDGRIWKRFNDPDGFNFLTKPRHYGFMMNLDWFCPYKHVKSVSVGAIYMVCMNLPRSERFKRKNVILVGLIPSCIKEPATNTFVKPLIDELLQAWHDGFNFKSIVDGQQHIYKCALLCVGCDIPATRKLCGFLGNLHV